MNTLLAVAVIGGLPLLSILLFITMVKLQAAKRARGLGETSSLPARLLWLLPIVAEAVAYLLFNVRGAALRDGFWLAMVGVLLVRAFIDWLQVRRLDRLQHQGAAA